MSQLEQELPEELTSSVLAARSKQAVDIKVLDVREVATFTDYFVIMTGTSARQVHAIVDEIRDSLKRDGTRVTRVEGYRQGEWVVLDYSDFVVHVFSPVKRAFYQLERLWSDAQVVEMPVEAA